MGALEVREKSLVNGKTMFKAATTYDALVREEARKLTEQRVASTRLRNKNQRGLAAAASDYQMPIKQYKNEKKEAQRARLKKKHATAQQLTDNMSARLHNKQNEIDREKTAEFHRKNVQYWTKLKLTPADHAKRRDARSASLQQLVRWCSGRIHANVLRLYEAGVPVHPGQYPPPPPLTEGGGDAPSQWPPRTKFVLGMQIPGESHFDHVTVFDPSIFCVTVPEPVLRHSLEQLLLLPPRMQNPETKQRVASITHQLKMLEACDFADAFAIDCHIRCDTPAYAGDKKEQMRSYTDIIPVSAQTDTAFIAGREGGIYPAPPPFCAACDWPIMHKEAKHCGKGDCANPSFCTQSCKNEHDWRKHPDSTVAVARRATEERKAAMLRARQAITEANRVEPTAQQREWGKGKVARLELAIREDDNSQIFLEKLKRKEGGCTVPEEVKAEQEVAKKKETLRQARLFPFNSDQLFLRRYRDRVKCIRDHRLNERGDFVLAVETIEWLYGSLDDGGRSSIGVAASSALVGRHGEREWADGLVLDGFVGVSAPPPPAEDADAGGSQEEEGGEDLQR
jgi:hypothetical protein